MDSSSNINLKNVSVINNTLDGMHLVSCSDATLTSINVTNHQHHEIMLIWCSSMSLKDISAIYSAMDGMFVVRYSNITLTAIIICNKQSEWNVFVFM